MKYFAKFLPVKGEIKIGDRAVDSIIAPKDGLVFQGLDLWLNEMGDQVILPDWKARFKFKKVKLFLCSRDIQVGDTYYNESFEFTKYPNNSIAGSSTEWVGENGSYKVIGEISEEAIWVKEEDEFNEDQITKLEYGYHSNCPLQECEKENKCLYNGWMECPPNIIKILGPCGHFH